jgi:hypothetical protein
LAAAAAFFAAFLGRLIGLSEYEVTRVVDVKIAYRRCPLTEQERAQIMALRIQRAKKHTEICACLAGALGYGTDTAAFSEERVSQVAEEADELIDTWADDVEESSDPGLSEKASRPEPGIQQLLAEHYALSDRIMAIHDEAWRSLGAGTRR